MYTHILDNSSLGSFNCQLLVVLYFMEIEEKNFVETKTLFWGSWGLFEVFGLISQNQPIFMSVTWQHPVGIGLKH